MNIRRTALLVLGTLACWAAGGIILHTVMPQSPKYIVKGTDGLPETAYLTIRETPPAPPLDTNRRWEPGGPDAKGNFVFFTWDGTPVYLLSDYGFALFNDGDEEHPRPVYALGFLKQQSVRIYRSFDAFQQALKEIPRGQEVYRHTLCTAGTAPGIGEETREEVARAFHRAQLKYEEERHVMYCNCAEGMMSRPDVPEELKANYIRLYGSWDQAPEKPVEAK